jgi:CMP-N-acetylneuraminic acid synthetase
MGKTITIFINARMGSSRCKNKLLRNFADSCLFEIALRKLEIINADEKYICAHEDIFFNFNHDDTVRHYRRTKESVTVDGPLIKVFESYYHFKSDYVMFLNPCHAHLKAETIQNAIDYFKESSFEAMTSVEKVNDWIFDSGGELLYPSDLAHGDTKRTADAYRAAHAFHIYNRYRFLDNDGFLWSWKKDDPHLYEIDKYEAIDIDSDIDFDISKSLYR